MPDRATVFAKALRAQATDAESLLWRHLRAHRFAGFKFKRQQPIGPYIVDFVCLSARIVIEVDGGQHSLGTSDEARARYLEANGYRVLRFWNNEVLENTPGVLSAIDTAINAERPPTPDPSPPQAGGGE